MTTTPASDRPQRHALTVHIPAYNCPELLGRCLAGLQWADEIVVEDASSDDRIGVLLAQKHPKVVHVRDREPDIRKRLLNSVRHGRGDYVLWVHTDEFYDETIGTEICESLRMPCDYAGFRIPSIDVNFGENFGAGAAQLRLFHKDRFRFPMRGMHDMPIVDGPVAILKHSYLHSNNPFFIVCAIKHFRYETISARSMETAALERLSLDRQGLRFYGKVAVQWLHINWTFLRHFLHYRRHGFGGLCMSYAGMIWQLARWMCATEELRIRAGRLMREDTRGYLDF